MKETDPTAEAFEAAETMQQSDSIERSNLRDAGRPAAGLKRDFRHHLCDTCFLFVFRAKTLGSSGRLLGLLPPHPL